MALLVQASSRVPFWGGFNVSTNCRLQSGQPWGRTATFKLTQGTETIRIEPRGTRRQSASSIPDVRAEKTFNLGASRSLGVYVDVFNLNNQGVGAFREPSGSTFDALSSWSSPRQVQAGLRFTF